MPIELQYENLDAVPEAFRAEGVFGELFKTEADGKITLVGVTGMKTQADVDTVREALRKEREDHAAVKASLKPWGSLDPTETLAKLDRIEELEAAAGGQLDEDKINQIVESRLAQKTGPLERQIQEMTETNTTLTQENGTLRTTLDSRDRNDVIRSVATEAKVHPTAMADIEMAASMMFEKDDNGQWITKADVAGVTPGQSPKEWLRDMTKLRPHWWPESQGGGAPGGGGNFGGVHGPNPWAHDSWNMSKQNAYLLEHGREAADRAAKSAGTTVGGTKPPKK